MAEYMANRRDKRRDKLVALAGGKCEQCGSLDRLEFNHRNRKDKLFGLSGAGLDKSWPTILVELDKCDLLCYTCHKRYTVGQWSSGEIRPWNDKTDLPYEHGTARMYQETKCKCGLCVTAKRMYRNKELGYDQIIPR